MAKFSKKVMGKEVGDASVYAEPHTMKGTALSAKDAMLSVSRKPDPNTLKATDMKPGGQPVPRVSAGDPGADDVKTSGIKMRGTGAATKGVMSRGPMG
jgi:hypothetical protein